MDSKIYVFDLFAGKYRNINLHNYDDDRQVGVLYFDRAVLDELSRICTICGYVFFEEDGISYPIDIQPQKVVIFEGTFNCLSSKVKAIFIKHNICPSDETKLSHFFYSWQLEGRFDCFDVHGEFIELCSMILERLEYSCLLPQHSIYRPANYCELCEMVKNIVYISHLDYRIEIMHFYKDGRLVKRQANEPLRLCDKVNSVFFSVEAHSPAASMIIDILNAFNGKMRDVREYSTELESIGVIPLCVSEQVPCNAPHRERRIVSLKKKYADIRTRIDYEAFVNSSHEEQVEMCRKNIEDAVKYIAKKDRSFKLNDFLRDLNK